MQPVRHARTPETGSSTIGRSTSNYDVLDYIYGMAGELAAMARNEGDEALAVLLEAASFRASLKIVSPG